MKYIDEVADLKGKVVLVRAGFNVPIENDLVRDDFRITKALPTLQFLKDAGAKIIVISHIGRSGEQSLRPVAEILTQTIPTTLYATIQEAKDLAREGGIALVENLRSDKRETENNDEWAREIASHADIFVQDAFEVLHREHTSVVGIPKYIESYGGLLVRDEVNNLQKAIEPEHPALFALGGGKLATKEVLMEKLIPLYDKIFIGGVLQNELLKARGGEVGVSKVGDGAVPIDILQNEKEHKVVDVVVRHTSGESSNVDIQDIEKDDTIVDMGEKTIHTLVNALSSFKTIVWNGPFGWYEYGFDEATLAFARGVAGVVGATTIVGGGDTIAVLKKENMLDSFTFVSTGGGAMLQFLQEGTLAGIEALEKNSG